MPAPEPMMACGHRANATESDGNPACAICVGIPGLHADSTTIDPNPPDLTIRTARCAYYGRPARGRSREGPCNGSWAIRDQPCLCERPSTDNLAFFEHRPSEPHDRYYCGCWGWD